MKKVCLIINPVELYTLTLLLLIITAQLGVAQVKISGVITDQKNVPLSYANVFIKGTYEGTVTDDSGRFILTTKLTGNLTLGASFIGMQNIF